MVDWFRSIGPVLNILPAETAHNLALKTLAKGWIAKPLLPLSPRLQCQFLGETLAHPFGLAAGFDKNAIAYQSLLKLGFGFVEIGGVTPQPQKGNPRPRLFRLARDRAIINRMGFNNEGAESIAARLANRRQLGIVGANLASNSASLEPIKDFIALIRRFSPLADYLTLDISCPNTKNGRLFLQPAPLTDLLGDITELKHTITVPPLFVKIGPDVADHQFLDLLSILKTAFITGLILTNTTAARPPNLVSRRRDETGGLSGAPLFQRSTELLHQAHQLCGNTLFLIGVGGVMNGEDAYVKLKAGARLIQIYTAFVERGPFVLKQMIAELNHCLQRDGFNTLADIIGSDAGAPELNSIK